MCFWFGLNLNMFFLFFCCYSFLAWIVVVLVFGCHQNTHSNGGSIIVFVSYCTFYVSSAGFGFRVGNKTGKMAQGKRKKNNRVREM